MSADISASLNTRSPSPAGLSYASVPQAPAHSASVQNTGSDTDIQNAFASIPDPSDKPVTAGRTGLTAEYLATKQMRAGDAASDEMAGPDADTMQAEWNEMLAQACSTLDPSGKFTLNSLNTALSKITPSAPHSRTTAADFNTETLRTALNDWMAKAPDGLDLAPVFSSDTMNLALSFFMAQTASESTRNVKEQITGLSKLVKERTIQMQQRLDESNAKAEKRKNMSIWQKIVNAIASVFTVIASACAVAVAGPAALPLLAISVAMLGMEIANLAGDSNASLSAMLMKLGVPEKVATWLGFGLELALSIGVGVGAALLAKGGLKAVTAGGNALLKSTLTAPKLVQAATTLQKVSTAATGVAGVASGSMTARSAVIKYEADVLQADAKGDEAAIERDNKFQQYLMQCFKEQMAASQKAVATFSAVNAETNRASTKVFA